MEAVILAGGLGTRLQKTVPYLPKALAPIQNIPFLEILLTQLEKSSIFSKIILCLGFKSEQIIRYLKTSSYSLPNLPLIEPFPMGTGGAILYALQEIKNSTFCVLNGDSYSDICLQDFHQFHVMQKAEISIACHELSDIRAYGSIEYDPQLRISSFTEKTAELKKGAISRGIYFFEKHIFEKFSLKECSLEKDLFPILVKKRMYAYPLDSTFIDIGTEETYKNAQRVLGTTK